MGKYILLCAERGLLMFFFSIRIGGHFRTRRSASLKGSLSLDFPNAGGVSLLCYGSGVTRRGCESVYYL
jgi:hypothetical protein